MLALLACFARYMELLNISGRVVEFKRRRFIQLLSKNSCCKVLYKNIQQAWYNSFTISQQLVPASTQKEVRLQSINANKTTAEITQLRERT